MDSIAVTKPDMAVTQRDRLGLSLFGMLSLAFGDEVRTRSAWQTGWYREEPLALLEEETTAPQGTGSNRELHLDVDLKVVLETLKKEQKEAGKRQQKEIAERILERVYLLERRVKETAPSQSHVTVQVAAPQASASHTAENKSTAQTARVPQPMAKEDTQKVVQQAVQEALSSVSTDRQKAQIRRKVLPGTQKLGHTANSRGMRTVEQERLGRLASPLTPITWSTAAPAGDGWKPRWQEEHPGFSNKKTQPSSDVQVGSILLPDQLRRRREQAIAQAEAQGEERTDLKPMQQRFTQTIADSVQRTLDTRNWTELEHPTAQAAEGNASVSQNTQELQKNQPASPSIEKAAQSEPNKSLKQNIPAEVHMSAVQNIHLPAEELLHHIEEPAETEQAASKAASSQEHQKSEPQTQHATANLSEQAVMQPQSKQTKAMSVRSGESTERVVSQSPVQQGTSAQATVQESVQQGIPVSVPSAQSGTPLPQEELLHHIEESTVAEKTASKTTVTQEHQKPAPHTQQAAVNSQHTATQSQQKQAQTMPARLEGASTQVALQESIQQGIPVQATSSVQSGTDLLQEELLHHIEESAEAEQAASKTTVAQEHQKPGPHTQQAAVNSQHTATQSQQKQAQTMPARSEESLVQAALQEPVQQGIPVQATSSVQSGIALPQEELLHHIEESIVTEQAASKPTVTKEHQKPELHTQQAAANSQHTATQSQQKQAQTMPARSEELLAQVALQEPVQQGIPVQATSSAQSGTSLLQEELLHYIEESTVVEQAASKTTVAQEHQKPASHTQQAAVNSQQTATQLQQKQVQAMPARSEGSAEQARLQQPVQQGVPSSTSSAQNGTVLPPEELLHHIEESIEAGQEAPSGPTKESAQTTKTQQAAQTNLAHQTAQIASKPLASALPRMQDAKPLPVADQQLVYHDPADHADAAETVQAPKSAHAKQAPQPQQKTAQPLQSKAAQIALARPLPFKNAAARMVTTEPMTPLTYAPVQQTASEAPVAGNSDLTYLPVQGQESKPEPPKKTEPAASSNYISTLPDWAQRFLQQPEGASHTAAPPKIPNVQPQQQVEWTAPQAMPSGTATMVFREPKQEAPQTMQQSPQLSDYELRRAADKVYHMIESRLRKEFRRSGR